MVHHHLDASLASTRGYHGLGCIWHIDVLGILVDVGVIGRTVGIQSITIIVATGQGSALVECGRVYQSVYDIGRILYDIPVQ